MYYEIEKQAIDAINKALDQYDEEIDRDFRLDFPPYYQKNSKFVQQLKN